MSVVAIFSASHCHGNDVAAAVAAKLELRTLEDSDVFEAAASRFEFTADKLLRSVHGPRSFFHRWTREREKSIAYVRSALADVLAERGDGLLYHSPATLLLPKSLNHVLRVCLVAHSDFRIEAARTSSGLDEKAARDQLQKDDRAAQEWAAHVLHDTPWDRDLYDIFLPMDATSVDEAIEIICENATKPPLRWTEASQQAITDFQLAAAVNVVLTEKGHDVFVTSENGEVTITIDHFVLRLKHLEEELRSLAREVPGVTRVHTRVGPHFNQPNIYPKLEMPQKILLVDDEKEFVQTLSERLETRDLEAALAFDGEEALTMIETDAPDVMVLDLKMPGIDGMEVLRRVKRDHPHTEVIILTGHGSGSEEKLAKELGAFACLQKPADIDVLARTMKEAYAKVQENKESQASGSEATTPSDA